MNAEREQLFKPLAVCNRDGKGDFVNLQLQLLRPRLLDLAVAGAGLDGRDATRGARIQRLSKRFLATATLPISSARAT